MVQISQKAGVDGKLFGSVTNADIEAALIAQGFEIERAMIRMPHGSLKQVGDHPVTIALHSEVMANIVVSVLGETTS
jgi:large subunit ribosomal protein L9